MAAPWMIVSALAAGLFAGRKALGREVLSRKEQAIEAAAQEARHRIRADAMVFMARSLRRFSLALLVKLVILAAIWGGYRGDLYDSTLFSALVAGALALFLLRDAWVNLPVIRFALAELRRYGWKPKQAFSECVAARVFEEVLAGAKAQPQTRSGALMLALAGQSRDALHQQVAEAVAEVARQTSWSDIRPYVVSAAIRFGALALVYSASVWMLLRL
ncbi:MAG: hypothetical protein KDA53_00545 [Hyphomonas sp.]|nr:hypothetical protein [Hyphomonas sp.]